MKKLSLLTILLAAAITASAAGQLNTSVRKISRFKLNKENVVTKQQAMQARKAPITDEPEGTVKELTRTGRADFVYNGQVHVSDQSGTTRFVFDDDGTTVYIRDILYNSGSYFGHSWVVGTIEGDKLVVPLGQSVYYDASYNADVVLSWGSLYVDDEQYFALDIDESVTEATYTIDLANGTYSLDGTTAPTSTDETVFDAYLGTGLASHWSDNNDWGGFMDWNTVFTDGGTEVVTPTLILDQPEGELMTFQRTGGCIFYTVFGLGSQVQEGKINVVFSTEPGKVYVQNAMMWYDYVGAWVEGTYDEATGIITIPTGQYIHWYPEDGYGVQMMWGSTYIYQDINAETGEPEYWLEYEIDQDVTEICYKIEGDKIYLLDSEGDLNAPFPENYTSVGIIGMWSDDQAWANAIEFNTYGEVLSMLPAVPADPVLADDAWYDCGDESGYSALDFTLPITDVEGNLLDPTLLSYSIYTDDDQLYTFVQDDYFYDLTEDATEIPYSVYAAGVDFHKGYVNFHRTNAEGYEPFFTRRIGIQVTYTVDVPETPGAPRKAPVANKSNIVYWELPGYSAIESVKAELDVNAPVYNIMGQKMNADNLPAGIYIQNGKKFVIK